MSIVTNKSISHSQTMPAKQLHKIVFGLLGVFSLFAFSYPLAMLRVSQMEKFRSFEFHGKSLTLEYQLMPENAQK